MATRRERVKTSECVVGSPYIKDVADITALYSTIKRHCAKINGNAFSYFEQLRKAQAFLLAHYGDEISLDEVAAAAGMQRHYFSKFFHAKTGVTFRLWLMHQRICQSLVLMRTSNLSITQVAFNLGYQELRTFQRQFRLHTECSPSLVRQTIQEMVLNGRSSELAEAFPPIDRSCNS